MSREPSTVLRCPECKDRDGQPRFVGVVPEPAIVTGIVPRVDLVPHVSARGGCGYSQCAKCHRFLRWEAVPGNIQQTSDKRVAA